jgi:hypothetical protein
MATLLNADHLALHCPFAKEVQMLFQNSHLHACSCSPSLGQLRIGGPKSDVETLTIRGTNMLACPFARSGTLGKSEVAELF